MMYVSLSCLELFEILCGMMKMQIEYKIDLKYDLQI